jgi:hypothetical protein
MLGILLIINCQWNNLIFSRATNIISSIESEDEDDNEDDIQDLLDDEEMEEKPPFASPAASEGAKAVIFMPKNLIDPYIPNKNLIDPG